MMVPKRLHLFEFSDLPFWPSIFRSLATDYLLTVADFYQPFSPKLDAVGRAMEAVGTDSIVDLCSGAGGPWPHLARELSTQRGRGFRLCLTDRYPDLEAQQRLSQVPGAEYLQEPVDARHVPRQLTGVRTLYNGFHHFQPDEARQILQDAVDRGQPIAIFEMLQRSWGYFAYMLLTPLLVWVVTPKMRPFHLSRLLWTFLIPVIPLCLLWDCLVSTLRCYTTEELTAMTESLDGDPYVWETGAYWHRALPVTYLVGYPRTARPDASAALSQMSIAGSGGQNPRRGSRC